MTPPDEPREPTDHDALIAACRQASLELLQRNLTPHGILAASRTEAAEARRYTRIFGRDAAICVMAMCGSGRPSLEQGAVASLDALAAQQAENGQIPKYVDPVGQDADFWQNEASDWADIMPRSGYVLYTNALWYDVKRRYGLAHAEATHHHFNHLFDPFQRDLPEYHRARLLRHYARRGRKASGLYLSFVNLAMVGHEGDVFGNVLAVLCGLADAAAGQRIVKVIGAAHAADPYPIRVVLHPLSRQHELWRPYMARHQQNQMHQYHNGGIWPFVGGYWVMALVKLGLRAEARAELARLAQVNALDGWRFTEWFHGRTLAPMGMAGQSWNAAAWLLAHSALERGASG